MNPIKEPIPSRRMLRMKQLTEYMGLSKSALYDLMNPKSVRYDATFPRAVPLTPGTAAWVLEEVDAWIDGRIASRGKGHAA